MSALYRSFLRVLEKWPVDPSKKGRDLGEYIRLCVGEAFRDSDPRDNQKCQEIQETLYRIGNNKYKDTFFVSTQGSACGLSEKECQQVVSNEFLQLMQEEEKGNLGKWKDKLLRK